VAKWGRSDAVTPGDELTRGWPLSKPQ